MLIFLFLDNTFCVKQRKSVLFRILIYVCFGFLLGAINGFFGGGGGMLCVPFLMLMGLQNKKAHATAILTMLPISIASAVVYYSHGFVNFWIVLWVSLGAIVGSIIGAIILKKMPPIVVLYVFPIIMIAAGVKMIV